MLSNRQAARAVGDIKFIGQVCDRCGGNIRYVKSGYCVGCQVVKNRKDRHASRPDCGPTAFNRPVFVLGAPPPLKK